ncbi:MAG: response regulator transcription factor [Rhodobacter sp.]|uniref:response regulator transcription factor n=1 Tax=Pararhodobacter sp. TaxID=2127056 RepID=UPI001DB87A9D|nr:response regulator transcription factor [Pararhodobacter sp.]MCB1346870.1 response regulator transcription factor [Paracoccaceae bacterium]MCC0072557.1 response regulator transcription factor [Rhodobacter sp.]HPD93625.1 response regulator transcription factor [Pararhodobacter sp.]
MSATFARALIVDDHPLFCDALALTLRGIAGVADVDCAHSLAAALERFETAPRPDLVLLDLDLPDVEGLDGLIRLRAGQPDLPVLVVSSMAEPRLVRAALAAGAAGFVPKHSGREAFRAALDALGRGDCWRPDGLGDETEAGTETSVARLTQLTRQQARILDLLCQGRLNKQIAWELSIAETTVKAHVTAIMRKLGVQSRTQAVLIAQQAKFTSFMPEA